MPTQKESMKGEVGTKKPIMRRILVWIIIIICGWIHKRERWSESYILIGYPRLALVPLLKVHFLAIIILINPLLTKLVWSGWLNIVLVRCIFVDWDEWKHVKGLDQYVATLISLLVDNWCVFIVFLQQQIVWCKVRTPRGQAIVSILSGCLYKEASQKKKNIRDTCFIDLETKEDILKRKRFFKKRSHL